MDDFIAWLTFFGAWILVAGSVYQAALELDAEESAMDRIRELRTKLPTPPPISRWWWLFPPARYEFRRRRANRLRRIIMALLTPQEYEVQTHFVNKATGWLYVAGGGFLLATGETYALVRALDWNHAITWLLVVVMSVFALGNTTARMRHSLSGAEEQQRMHEEALRRIAARDTGRPAS